MYYIDDCSVSTISALTCIWCVDVILDLCIYFDGHTLSTTLTVTLHPPRRLLHHSIRLRLHISIVSTVTHLSTTSTVTLHLLIDGCTSHHHSALATYHSDHTSSRHTRYQALIASTREIGKFYGTKNLPKITDQTGTAV